MTDLIPKVAVSQRDKHWSNAGETLVETLVSILISALALLVLATAIGTSVNIVRSSKNKMDGMYASESEFVAAYASSTGGGSESSVEVEVPLVSSGVSENVKVYTDREGTVGVYRRVP